MSSAATERPESSPPARGSSSIGAIDTVFKDVLPARAGIVRRPRRIWRRRRCPPRPRGDRPPVSADQAAADTSSPPARGSSYEGGDHGPRQGVLPARAGIVRERHLVSRVVHGPPRPRGDRPSIRDAMTQAWESSPPARGSSVRGADDSCRVVVLPARAGIVLCGPCPHAPGRCPPRPRGDRPEIQAIPGLRNPSSPPARGSSLHPGAL